MVSAGGDACRYLSGRIAPPRSTSQIDQWSQIPLTLGGKAGRLARDSKLSIYA
jgi:hypothetical protein